MNKQNKYNILIFFCTIIFFYACQSTSVHANQVQIIESAAPVKYLSNSSQKVDDTSLNSKDSAPSEHNGATDEKTVLPDKQATDTSLNSKDLASSEHNGATDEKTVLPNKQVADTSLNSKDSVPSEHNGATDEKTVLPDKQATDTSLNSKDLAPSEHNGATDEKTVLPNQIEKSSEEPIITLIKKYFDSSNATDIFSIFHLTKKSITDKLIKKIPMLINKKKPIQLRITKKSLFFDKVSVNVYWDKITYGERRLGKGNKIALDISLDDNSPYHFMIEEKVLRQLIDESLEQINNITQKNNIEILKYIEKIIKKIRNQPVLKDDNITVGEIIDNVHTNSLSENNSHFKIIKKISKKLNAPNNHVLKEHLNAASKELANLITFFTSKINIKRNLDQVIDYDSNQSSLGFFEWFIKSALIKKLGQTYNEKLSLEKLLQSIGFSGEKLIKKCLESPLVNSILSRYQTKLSLFINENIPDN